MRLRNIPLTAALCLLAASASYAQNATRPKNPIRLSYGVTIGLPETGDADNFTGIRDPENRSKVDGDRWPYRVGLEYDFYRTPARTPQIYYGFVEYFRARIETVNTSGGGLSPFQSPGRLSYIAAGVGVRAYPFGIKRGGANFYAGLGVGLYKANSEVYGLIGDENALQYGKATDDGTRVGARVQLGWDFGRVFLELFGTYAGSTSTGLPNNLNNTGVALGFRL